MRGQSTESRQRRLLAERLKKAVRRSGLQQSRIAAAIGYDRSRVSHAIRGEVLPSWDLTEALARVCGLDIAATRSLWERADKARRDQRTWLKYGCPPPGMESHSDMCEALEMLRRERGLSLRQLEGKDAEGALRRDALTAVLRGEQPLSLTMTIRITYACGLPWDRISLWAEAWTDTRDQRAVSMLGRGESPTYASAAARLRREGSRH